MILLTNISHNGFTNYINGFYLLFFIFNSQMESHMVIIIIVWEAVVMLDFICLYFSFQRS